MLWLLLVLPMLVAAYVWALRRKKKAAVRYPNVGLVREAVGPGQSIRRHVPAALLLAGLAAAIIAVARPNAVIPSLSNQQTVVLAIDVSLSMRASDVDPSRITAAQAAAKAFFEELPPPVRVGIVSFAATASLVQAPTHSREDLLAAVDRLQLQRHTATGSALLVSLATLLPDTGIDVEALALGTEMPRLNAKPKPIERAAKAEKATFKPVPPGSYGSGAIVLLSDGRRTMGPDPIEAARMAADRGVKVYTVGFGTPEGGAVDFGGWSIYMKLDEETLKQIAEITRAEYFHAGTALELKKVYQQLTSRLVVEKKETEMSALVTALGALLVITAAALSLLWFNRVG
jgi:Ca-activated chloride channel family protein